MMKTGWLSNPTSGNMAQEQALFCLKAMLQDGAADALPLELCIKKVTLAPTTQQNLGCCLVEPAVFWVVFLKNARLKCDAGVQVGDVLYRLQHKPLGLDGNRDRHVDQALASDDQCLVFLDFLVQLRRGAGPEGTVTEVPAGSAELENQEGDCGMFSVLF